MRTAREIAVRGFINEKFNTTFGKDLFRRAVFNGSVEVRNPNHKYLIDLYEYPHWEATAKTDQQMIVIHQLEESKIAYCEGVLASWIQYYDPLTKFKQMVDGFCVYAPNTQEFHIEIHDAEHDTDAIWTLDAHLCKNTGPNKPIFIATNVDLR